MYELGKNLKLHVLYPEVEFPVSSKTPMISPLIKWEHKKDWHLDRFELNVRRGQRALEVDLTEPTWSYISGHMIDGNFEKKKLTNF